MPNNNPQQTSSQQSSTRTDASSKIGDRIEQTADQTSKLVDRLEHTAEEKAQAAIQRVRDARQQAQSGLEEQREQVAERMRRLAGVLRGGAESMRDEDPLAQSVLHTVGDRIERTADYVATLSAGHLADDVQTFARRRPGMFFGGAFLLGLGLGRFARSTGSGATGGRHRSFDDGIDSPFSEDTSGLAQESGASYGASADTSPSYGAGTSGTMGSSLPYGVGGSASSSGTSGSSSTSSSTSGGSTASRTGTGSGSTAAAGGLGGTSASGSSTPNATPHTEAQETQRGQGSKS